MVNTYFGRLCFDVEVKEVGEEKKKVMNNRLAMRVSKNQTTFIDLVAWEGTAELIAKYYKKGYEILLQGTLINKKVLVGEKEIEGVAISVNEIIFTSGNPKENEE